MMGVLMISCAAGIVFSITMFTENPSNGFYLLYHCLFFLMCFGYLAWAGISCRQEVRPRTTINFCVYYFCVYFLWINSLICSMHDIVFNILSFFSLFDKVLTVINEITKGNSFEGTCFPNHASTEKAGMIRRSMSPRNCCHFNNQITFTKFYKY